MDESIVILDPTDERKPMELRLAERPSALAGPVGIIDISKPRGDVFCDELEVLLRERSPGIGIIRLRKPTFTRPAPEDLREEVAEKCRTVIQALAD